MVIPVCSRATATVARTNPAACELIHPSPDRRDWRRWLKGSGHDLEVDITRGQVFDMLEQGIAAAIAGHGISIGDLALCATAIDEKQLVLPFKTAVNTGTRTTSCGRTIQPKPRRCANCSRFWKAGCRA